MSDEPRPSWKPLAALAAEHGALTVERIRDALWDLNPFSGVSIEREPEGARVRFADSIASTEWVDLWDAAKLSSICSRQLGLSDCPAATARAVRALGVDLLNRSSTELTWYARRGDPLASFSRVPNDQIGHFTVSDWVLGTALSETGSRLYSLHAEAQSVNPQQSPIPARHLAEREAEAFLRTAIPDGQTREQLLSAAQQHIAGLTGAAAARAWRTVTRDPLFARKAGRPKKVKSETLKAKKVEVKTGGFSSRH